MELGAGAFRVFALVLFDRLLKPAEIMFLEGLIPQWRGSFPTLEIVELFQSLLVDELVDKFTPRTTKS